MKTNFCEQCSDCQIGRHPYAACPVALAQSRFNYEQYTKGKPNKVAEVLDLFVDSKGTCMMRKIIQRYINNEPDSPINPKMVLPGMEEWAKRAGVK